MELRHLRYFVTAAEEAHFGRAAQRLGISRPALGQQIRELEQELGVELFERLRSGVRLTAAGTALLGDAHRLLSEFRAATAYVQQMDPRKVAVLRVGHIPMGSLQGTRIDKIIATFCLRYPDVEVQALDLNTAEQYAALDEGRIDVGIGYTQRHTPSRFRREMLDDNMLDGALLPAAHPLARKSPLYCRDLGELPLLIAPASTHPTGHEVLVRELRARGLKVQGGHEPEITDPLVRISLVAAGAGWMPANAAAVEAILAGSRDIVFRTWQDAPIRHPCCILWRASDRSASVGNFLGLCRELRVRPKSTVLNKAARTSRAGSNRAVAK